MNTRRQQQLLLEVLRKGPCGTIELREQYGIAHPAGRVQDLRRRGFPILTVRTRQVDAASCVHRCAVYVLGGGGHDA
jgi:hypothetical protein